jgi:hypothetical protein
MKTIATILVSLLSVSAFSATLPAKRMIVNLNQKGTITKANTNIAVSRKTMLGDSCWREADKKAKSIKNISSDTIEINFSKLNLLAITPGCFNGVTYSTYRFDYKTSKSKGSVSIKEHELEVCSGDIELNLDLNDAGSVVEQNINCL